MDKRVAEDYVEFDRIPLVQAFLDLEEDEPEADDKENVSLPEWINHQTNAAKKNIDKQATKLGTFCLKPHWNTDFSANLCSTSTESLLSQPRQEVAELQFGVLHTANCLLPRRGSVTAQSGHKESRRKSCAVLRALAYAQTVYAWSASHHF